MRAKEKKLMNWKIIIFSIQKEKKGMKQRTKCKDIEYLYCWWWWWYEI